MSVSSSIEIQEAIEKIIDIERDSVREMKTDRSDLIDVNSALAAIDTSLEALQSKIAALTTSSTFYSNQAVSSDTNILTASATTTAVQTVYQVTVNQLAQVARATSSSAIGLSEGTYAVWQSGEPISASGGSSTKVNPNIVFASGTAAVGFDMDKVVVSGSFKVNGKAIAVTGSDTIYTILSKINSENLGVTATFDIAEDKVVLTSTSIGAGKTLELTDDTSGFLDAVKLAAVNGNPPVGFTDGTSAGVNAKLNTTSMVSGANAVTNGYFTINNITFKVDTATDSISSILSSINNSKAGVSAYYDEIEDKITISSRTTGKDVYFENDTSNFLKKINLLDSAGDLDATEGKSRYTGTKSEVLVNGQLLQRDGNTFSIGGTTFTLKTTGQSNVTVTSDTQTAVNAVKGFVDQYNNTISLIDSKLKGVLKNDRSINNVKRKLQQIIVKATADDSTFKRLSDIGVYFVGTGGYGLGTLRFRQSEFTSALNDNKEDVFKLFETKNDGSGFTNKIDSYLKNMTNNSTGSFAIKTNGNIKLIKQIEKRIEKEENRLEKRAKDLQVQYQELNSAVVAMEKQMNSFNSFASSMANITSSYWNQ
ncbi:MAG: flagellar filament capping protein FliD [Candidatus Auribacterota bacterium]|jgi:flagellar hook-associated protein 2|nr:flagellar filament capping protein FliD [Candidatus Auribacterota bacterium]